MGRIGSMRTGDIPPDASLEVWEDGTVWISFGPGGRARQRMDDYLREQEGTIPGPHGAGWVKVEPTDAPGHVLLSVRSMTAEFACTIMDEDGWAEMNRRHGLLLEAQKIRHTAAAERSGR